MDDIYNGILAQIELIEEFYNLNVKEHMKIKQIKKGLKELIKLYEKDTSSTTNIDRNTILFVN